MSETVKKLSQEELAAAYLSYYLEQWVSYERLRVLFKPKGDDAGRLCRKLREKGWPLEFNGKAEVRLRRAPMQPVTAKRTNITPTQRARIFDRDGGCCQLCGIHPGELAEDGRPARMHVDHIVRVKDGGLTEDDNLRVLCHVHNHDRG